MQHFEKILITDFDGTITKRDFFYCVVEKLLKKEDLAPWDRYTRGEITHFEALRQIFLNIRVDESKIEAIFEYMEIDPGLAEAVKKLEKAGWKIIIVSNGCLWYVDIFLKRAGVNLEVYSNPGHYSRDTGLVMELPTASPFFSPETGISKLAVVEDALRNCGKVFFAGDGRPDISSALLIPAESRFAREWLAEHLESLKEGFHRFERWSEIANYLVSQKI